MSTYSPRISQFSHCCDKIPNRGYLREERYILGVVWEGTEHHSLEGMVAGAVVLAMGTFIQVYYILADDKAGSLCWKWSPLITLKSHPLNNLPPVATLNLLKFQDDATNWGPNTGAYGGTFDFQCTTYSKIWRKTSCILFICSLPSAQKHVQNAMNPSIHIHRKANSWSTSWSSL